MADMSSLSQALAQMLGTPTLLQSPLIEQVVALIFSVVQLIVLFGTGYYYLLLIASAFPRRMAGSLPDDPKSFAIAIPAHNEETVLYETLIWLKKQSYPSALFDIYVVADHCNDNTEQVAHASGAICYSRNEGSRGRKAYALQWLLQKILASGKRYDAFLIFDADSHVDPGFLRAMSRSLDADHIVLQGKHVILDAEQSSFGKLASLDMRLNNLLHNQAKQNLSLSCRLMGDAMCFASSVILKYGWPTESLGEDREYGLYLLTQGIRVGYVPEALSYGQAAPGWRAASGQRLRWYGGARQIQRKLAFGLLKLGLRKHDGAALDGAIELLLPPFSVLTLLSACLAFIQGLLNTFGALLPFAFTIGIMLSWIIFPFLGLIVDGAPTSSYRALLYAPFYLIWRVLIGVWARVKGDRVRWVRTKRREET